MVLTNAKEDDAQENCCVLILNCLELTQFVFTEGSSFWNDVVRNYMHWKPVFEYIESYTTYMGSHTSIIILNTSE